MSRRLERSSLWQLTLARMREFGREPEAVFWTFFFPVLMALALGIAFGGGRGGETVHVAVESGGEEVAAILDAVEGFRVRRLNPGEADLALRRGEVAVVVVAAADGLRYRYDPDRPEARLARLQVDDALQRAAGRDDVLTAGDEPVREPGGRYIDFLIPGLIGLNLLSTGLWGAGYSIVRMRTGKLLKRFIATPMRRGEFLLSFMLGRLVFLAAELAVLLLFAWLVFGVTVQGSLAALLFIAVLGAFTFTGVGLLVASRSRTQEGVSGLMNLVSVPMWILSGVFFSYHHFPEVMHPFIRALPLTGLNDAMRAVMNEGAALAATAGSLAVVLGWGIASFAVALAVFRWR